MITIENINKVIEKIKNENTHAYTGGVYDYNRKYQ